MMSLKTLFQKPEKNVPKSWSHESDECLAYLQYSHTCFQIILKISGKNIKPNRNGGLKTLSALFTELQYTANILFVNRSKTLQVVGNFST